MREAPNFSAETKAEQRFPALFGRIMAIIVSSIVGPLIASFIIAALGCIGILLSMLFSFNFGILALFISFALPGLFFGPPIALAIGVFGLIINARSKEISLKAVLIVTGIGMFSALMIVYEKSLFSDNWQQGVANISYAMAVFLFPSLLSAALCWWWLSSWHSPETPP